MTSIGKFPALALLAGAVCGIWIDGTFSGAVASLPPLCAIACAAWLVRWPRLTVVCLLAVFSCSGAGLAAHARETALRPSLRVALDREFGRFDLDTPGPEGEHDPIVTRAVLIEDASSRETYVALRARVIALWLGREWHDADGGISVSVNAAAALKAAPEWSAGRTIEAPMTFRRAARYLNDGVPDFERDLALDGVTLLASVKSGLLVQVVARGNVIEEAAAAVRAHVRRAVGKWVAPLDATSAAIVDAVLIGDRTGLAEDVREALQSAGTYHVIAISGGNIAILAACAGGILMLFGVRGRTASVAVIAILLAYAAVVTPGPSVWRATLMAILYMLARTIDQRTPAWHAAGVAAAAIITAHPLDVRDPGFILTFGATSALLYVARWGHVSVPRHRVLAWLVAPMVASAAVEVVLLPVSAQTFSRVTGAGVLLNLAAVPLMAIVQLAGIVVVVADAIPPVASAAGWIAHAAAFALVRSSQLVSLAPWTAARVPPPGMVVVLIYYAALGGVMLGRPRVLRRACVAILAAAALLITGIVPRATAYRSGEHERQLRLTVFDVGQGDAALAQLPDGSAIVIDAGGMPFGGGSFDIGERVLAPTLWARGLGSLDALLITHGDPDHIGGAPSLLRDFTPRSLWEGIRVPRHAPGRDLLRIADEHRVRIEQRRAGQDLLFGPVHVRVLHPPDPDWERQRVRNDDSVVVELLYGDVALLLTGDISADVERAIVPHLSPARTRILKVAHHGSRTSSSEYLLDTWRPQIAVISCGRGNPFGHPAPEVLQRLEAVGAEVFRTDLDGQITIETDGQHVRVRTFVGVRP